MSTQLISKALLTAAIGIALSSSLAAPTTASAASSIPAGTMALDPPAAPSHVRAWTTRVPDPSFPHGYYTLYFVSWNDNAGNEDGFILEEWQKVSGTWVLAWSAVLPANTTAAEVDGNGQRWRFRVRAFNAAGESEWSNWGR